VFKPAIMAGFCTALLLGHNHPSGDPEPSAEDVVLTRRLASAGALLGIDVLDHLILGEAGRFVSLKSRGVL
jgi:DNA repair protein RadC